MSRRPFRVAAAAMAILIPVSILTFSRVPRYEPASGELVANPAFGDDLDSWRVHPGSGEISASDGEVRLHNRDPEGFVGLRQVVSLDDPPIALRFTADVATEAIRPGAVPWHAGRVYLILQHESGSRDLDRYHVLWQDSGTLDWTRFSSTVPLFDRVGSASLNIQLRRSTGRLTVRAPSLTPLHERSTFSALRLALLAAWGAVLAFTAVAFAVRARRSWAMRVGLVGIAVLLVGALAPEDVKRQLLGAELVAAASRGVVEVLANLGLYEVSAVDPDQVDLSLVEGAFHFSLFAFLAAVVLRTGAAGSRWMQLGWLALFAGGTEVLQLFVDGRDPSLADWIVDLAGLGVVHLGAAMFRGRGP